ncbi:MAG: site-specific integrase, partial [Candidatus Dadabacteria bacterium]|nr:site-specific integrase [Candidatus Dadabacteria bacterium]
MSTIIQPKAPRKVISYLTKDEFELLIRAIEADIVLKGKHIGPNQVRWLIDLIKVAVGTGLRRGELLNLRWDSVDLTKRAIDVTTSAEFQTKSGHERTVFMAGVALATIERLETERTSERSEYVFTSTTGGKLSPGYVSKRFRYYRRLADLPDHIHFHSLRHTYASWLVLAGVDLYRVQELMGLSTVQLVMRYAHLA